MIVRCNWLNFGRVRLVFSALCLLLFLGVTSPLLAQTCDTASTPTNLRVQRINDLGLRIRWDKASGSSPDSYTVLRQRVGLDSLTEVVTGLTYKNWTDTSVDTIGQGYRFKVVAVTGATTSCESAELNVVPTYDDLWDDTDYGRWWPTSDQGEFYALGESFDVQISKRPKTVSMQSIKPDMDGLLFYLGYSEATSINRSYTVTFTDLEVRKVVATISTYYDDLYKFDWAEKNEVPMEQIPSDNNSSTPVGTTIASFTSRGSQNSFTFLPPNVGAYVLTLSAKKKDDHGNIEGIITQNP